MNHEVNRLYHQCAALQVYLQPCPQVAAAGLQTSRTRWSISTGTRVERPAAFCRGEEPAAATNPLQCAGDAADAGAGVHLPAALAGAGCGSHRACSASAHPLAVGPPGVPRTPCPAVPLPGAQQGGCLQGQRGCQAGQSCQGSQVCLSDLLANSLLSLGQDAPGCA